MVLIERDVELSKLNDLFLQTHRDQGKVALVTGPPGCGKTALLTAFGKHVTAAGGQFAHIICSRTEQDLLLGVIDQLFQALDVLAEIAGRLHAVIQDSLLAGRPEEPAAQSPGNRHAADQTRSHLAQWVCAALLDRAQRQPVVIAIDDIWHADPASLSCLLHLSRRLRRGRLMLIFTESLSSQSPCSLQRADLLRHPSCAAISLTPLSARDTAQLMVSLLSPKAAQYLSPDCFLATGGNPLLVRAFAADQAQQADGGAAEPSTLCLGAAFAQAVVGCLYRHDDVTRSVASGLAVLGESAKPGLTSQLLDMPAELGGQAVKLLEASGLLVAGRFRNSSIQRAILDDMWPYELCRMHRRAAELRHADGAAPEVIAWHLVQAGWNDASWTVPVLRDAAEQALATGDREAACACLRLANRADTSLRERAATTAVLVRAQWPVNPLAILGHLGELMEAAQRGELAARAELTIVPYLLWHGQVAEAVGSVNRVTTSPDFLDPHTSAQLRAVQQLASWFSPDPVTDSELPSGTATPQPSAAFSINTQLQAITVLAQALTGGPNASSCGAEQILQRCELERAALGSVVAALVALVCTGRADRAIIWSEVFLRQPGNRAAPAWYAILQAIRAEAALRVGDLIGAEDHARTALTALPAQAWGAAIGVPLAALLLAATETGDFDQASYYLSVPVPPAMLHSPIGPLYLRARGRYYLATGRHQAALSDFQSCAQMLSRRHLDLSALIPWRLEMARALIRLGDMPAAARLASQQLHQTNTLDPHTRGTALRLLAATTTPSRRTALLKEAVDVLQRCDDRVELAHALADLGRAMEARGDSVRAGMMLRRAYQLGRTCGAKLLCSSLLFNRPQPAPTDAPASVHTDAEHRLNDGERQVAILAAQGRTNREIAGKLFITVSTVEQRLTRVYRKLEIKRRVELPIGLADSGAPRMPASYTPFQCPIRR